MRSGEPLGIQAIVDLLAMERHPTAGWYSLHYSESELLGRSRLSSMYHLIAGDEPLPLHRSDGVAVWHHHLGAAAEITVTNGALVHEVSRVGPDLLAGERPQLAVPAHFWHGCRSLGTWTLFGCVLSPGYSSRATFVLSADD